MSHALVIREVCKNVWTFSCPFSVFGILAIGGRSTAIRLRSGEVWILASTPLCPTTKAKLNELGPVKYIVSPNSGHWLFVEQYKSAYPAAKLLGSQMTTDKCKAAFDGVIGSNTTRAKFGFEDEVEYQYFSGHRTQDIAFLHIESRTLLTADLIINFPLTEQYSKSRSCRLDMIPVIGNVNPKHWLHRIMTYSKSMDTSAMERDARKVFKEWDFDRIIPCHGSVIETGGKQAWEDAFRSYLG